MGTKNDPGRFDCYAKLEENEPYFLLRGKDPIAWLLVRLWATLRRQMADGAPSEAYEAKLQEAENCSRAMHQYATVHPANHGHRAVLWAIECWRKVVNERRST